MAGPYSLAAVLEVAKIHPFYNSNIKYPPDAEAIQAALQKAATGSLAINFDSQPLLRKEELYKIIERLTFDTCAQNGYRRSSYISTTGGGSGGFPMMFATDSKENRQQRAAFGAFMAACGIVEPEDWVLSTHTSGYLYRSLDLTSELLENAGASVLCAGSRMPPAEVVGALAQYHANVLTGDSSQIIQIVDYIARLPELERQRISLNKIIYTSETLTESQRSHILASLGPVDIYSLLGSAEAGPYAISNPKLTGDSPPGTRDFVFDTRAVLIEIFDGKVLDGDSSVLRPVPDGEQGIVVQTSLQRLRNPLVRYITGDIGSLHPLPAAAGSIIPESELQHFRVLRLVGRDPRFSFKWYGEYFEFRNIVALMQTVEFGILQWQVVLGHLGSSPQPTLELRIFRAAAGERLLDKDALVERIEKFFFVFPENRHLFRITFLDSMAGFEKSSTGNKVMKFVDKTR